MEPMISRFLDVKDSIEKALVDLYSIHLWKSQNIPILCDILNSLQPIKLAVEALSRRNATILSSEAILQLMFSKLETQNSPLSLKLDEHLKIRLDKRRNKNLVSLAVFLNDPCAIRSQNKNNFFSYSTKASIIRICLPIAKPIRTESYR